MSLIYFEIIEIFVENWNWLSSFLSFFVAPFIQIEWSKESDKSVFSWFRYHIENATQANKKKKKKKKKCGTIQMRKLAVSPVYNTIRHIRWAVERRNVKAKVSEIFGMYYAC